MPLYATAALLRVVHRTQERAQEPPSLIECGLPTSAAPADRSFWVYSFKFFGVRCQACLNRVLKPAFDTHYPAV